MQKVQNQAPSEPSHSSQQSFLHNLSPWILSTSIGILMLLQIILGYLLYKQDGHPLLRYIGLGVFVTSGIFGILPIFELRQKGEVLKGERFVRTTKLVDTGIYGIVRHPQYFGALLINIALFLISQNWIVGILGIIAIVLTYLDAVKADKYCIQKFGDAYKDYMKRVPRMNVISGILRKLANN